jgi:hypothetical protein
VNLLADARSQEGERGYVDKGYGGHDIRRHPARTATPLRYRAHDRPPQSRGHLGRCYLSGRAGGAANAILSAIKYNFQSSHGSRVLLRQILIAIVREITRDLNEDVRDRVRALANTETLQRSRRERKKVEMRFVHMKRILSSTGSGCGA